VLNELNGIKTQGITGPRLQPGPAPVADDPFGSDADLDAFLSGWVQSDTSNLDTLAQVASAPTPPAATPSSSPDDDATRGIEFLVLQNRSVFAKATSNNAPSRLLMTDDNTTLQPSSGSAIFDDATAWKLFDSK